MGFLDALAQVDRAVIAVVGGDSVTYAPGSGDPVDVVGVFDDAFQLVDPSDVRAGVMSTGPAVFLRLSDLPSDPSTDSPTLTIHALAYRVRESKPDGMGGVVLLLSLI